MGSTDIADKRAISIEEKQVGVLGSPNTLDLFVMDLVKDYMDESLYGKLLKFNHLETRDGTETPLHILCQVAKMENKNIWHEQYGMRSLIKVRGHLTNLSGDADLKLCSLTYLGAYKGEGEHWETENIGTPPRSGEPVSFVSQKDIDSASCIAKECKWYMGLVPGTELIVPFAIRHFGRFADGGAGEARMYGVFGQSGSGKSIVAAELIGGFARHKSMGVLIIDPQGEFYDNKFAINTAFNFDFHELVRATGKTQSRNRIHEIQIDDDPGLFVELLKLRNVLDSLGFKTEDKQVALAPLLADAFYVRIRNGQSIAQLALADLCAEASQLVDDVYAAASRPGVQSTIGRASNNANVRARFEECRAFFEPRLQNGKTKERLQNLVQKFLSGELAIISLAGGHTDMSVEDKSLIVKQIVGQIIREAESRFNTGGQPVNGLIVLDEAHRYAAQKYQDEEISPISKSLRKTLENATRETRKYGLGWLFITQSIVGFSKDIYRQMTDIWYGFGLTIGADAEYVENRVGKEAYEMYAHFPNPKQTQKYLFLAYGSSIALGTMGKPVVIEGIHSFDDFLRFNELQRKAPP